METTKKSRAEPKTDRRLKPAPRAKKNWTPEEDAFLQDKWGTLSIPIIAKQLGRSVGAINNRRYRLGCGAHLENDHRVSLNQLGTYRGRCRYDLQGSSRKWNRSE